MDKTVSAQSRLARELAQDGKRKGRGKGLGPVIDHEKIKRLLWDTHNVSSRERVIVVDCRGFRDPTRGRWHVGVHPDNMAAFFAHPDFDPWLANVAGDFGEAVRKGSTHIVFVVYCRKGVHRSISGGSVLFHCVRMDSRVLLASTQHTSALLWKHDHCGECARCRAPSSRCQAILRQAAERWLELRASPAGGW